MIQTRKKRSEELRADLWSMLGPDGASALLAALDNDNLACLALADHFEGRDDVSRASLARAAYPEHPRARQDLGSLYDLLCTMPSLKTVCSQDRTASIDVIHQGRQAGSKKPEGYFDALDGWMPAQREDPDGSVRDQYDYSAYRVCCRLRHCSFLFDRGCEGWDVPFDVGKQVIEFRRLLRRRVSERLLPFLSSS